MIAIGPRLIGEGGRGHSGARSGDSGGSTLMVTSVIGGNCCSFMESASRSFRGLEMLVSGQSIVIGELMDSVGRFLGH